LNSLASLIGAEDELGGKAVAAGWAKSASQEQITAWRDRGIKLTKEDLEIEFQRACTVEYAALMRKVRAPHPLR